MDLADAILALQVLSGLNPDGIQLNADANGNGKIGLEEVIYTLQVVAGLKPVGAATVSGVVAAGAPVVGVVNIKGANGATASSPIQADGSYSIDVTGLTVPYILYAEGSVNEKSITMYSAGVGPEINITPVTDFILRNALAGQAETAWDSWNTTQVDQTVLENAETKVQEQLAPLLNAVGVPADVDLITTPFNADNTGMDMVLEALDIGYDGNVATLTNEFTGSSYTDDITNSIDGDGLPASDKADTQLVLTDNVHG